MTNIPKARKLIAEALESEDAPSQFMIDSLKEALQLMTRVVKNKPRPSGRAQMTAELGHEARRLRRTTKLTNGQIGAKLNVDGGRVSEALNGMWY